MAPAVLLIDELDLIGPGGGGPRPTPDPQPILDQMVTEIEDPSPRRLVVVGATSRPDRVPARLFGPGRFDRTICLELPDKQARLEMLSLHAREEVLDQGVD